MKPTINPVLPIPTGYRLLVTGSLSAKEPDRWMSRDQIRPMQILHGTEQIAVSLFDNIGDLGVSSVAWDRKRARLWVSTGADLYRLCLGSTSFEPVEVEGLRDVHEIEIIRGRLAIANTGRQEVVFLDLDSEQVVHRISLPIGTTATEQHADPAIRYHPNIIFHGHDGDDWVLVHHIEGRQVLRQVASRMLKVQGDGGVVNLRTGDAIPLRLTAPHSVTVLDSGYLVFDSGQRTVRRYSPAWELELVHETTGWGRGAAASTDPDVLFCAMSPIRERYLGVIGGPAGERFASVDAIDIRSLQTLATTRIGGVEQLNNIYLLPESVCEALSGATLVGTA